MYWHTVTPTHNNKIIQQAIVTLSTGAFNSQCSPFVCNNCPDHLNNYAHMANRLKKAPVEPIVTLVNSWGTVPNASSQSTKPQLSFFSLSLHLSHNKDSISSFVPFFCPKYKLHIISYNVLCDASLKYTFCHLQCLFQQFYCSIIHFLATTFWQISFLFKHWQQHTMASHLESFLKPQSNYINQSDISYRIFWLSQSFINNVMLC